MMVQATAFQGNFPEQIEAWVKKNGQTASVWAVKDGDGYRFRSATLNGLPSKRDAVPAFVNGNRRTAIEIFGNEARRMLVEALRFDDLRVSALKVAYAGGDEREVKLRTDALAFFDAVQTRPRNLAKNEKSAWKRLLNAAKMTGCSEWTKQSALRETASNYGFAVRNREKAA